jgi:hypothetical protein
METAVKPILGLFKQTPRKCVPATCALHLFGSLARAFWTKRTHFSFLNRFILWQNSGAQKEMLDFLLAKRVGAPYGIQGFPRRER